MASTIEGVVLVGGQGTRLRPLTERTPKPMLPVLDRPLLAYVVDPLLAWTRLSRLHLAAGIHADSFQLWAAGMGVEVALEDEPRGTAGALGVLGTRLAGTLLVQNGDAFLWPDLEAVWRQHRQTGAQWTMVVCYVEPADRFGRVELDPAGRLLGFTEKRNTGEGGWINAGIYLLEPELWSRLPSDRFSSLEQEWFPQWLNEGVPACGFRYEGYFRDLGTLESFREVHFDLLQGRTPLRPGTEIWQGPRVCLGPGCELVGPLVLGEGSQVGAGARLERCVLLPGSRVAEGESLFEQIREAP